MKQLFCFLVITICSSISLGQSNFYTEISQSEDHKILTELMELTQIDEVLADGKYYSIFAPDDEAFLTAFSESELDSLKLNAPDLIKKYILHHIVQDTVEVGSSDYHLPLYGNIIIQFIDGAGQIIVGSTAGTPYPYVEYSEPLTEFEDGRIIWIYSNILHFSTDSLHQIFHGSIGQILNTTGLQDSLESNDTLLTLITPQGTEFIDYLESNINDINTNSPFLDSLMRRHIITGFYPLQEIEDGLTVKTWSNELLRFTVEGEKYFINGEEVISQKVELDGVFLYTKGPILPSTLSNTVSLQLETFNLFPNPSSSEIQIQTSLSNKEGLINIYTIQGQHILEIRTQSDLTKIDISDFKPGLYFVEYKFENIKKVSKLLVH